MSGTNRLGIKGAIASLIAAGALCTGAFAQLVCDGGPCGEPNDTPGCEDPECCAAVCELDPLCCLPGFEWDQQCANIALDLGCADGDGCPPAGPPPSGCIPAPAGLISWWPADGNANDIEDDNDGTLLGGAGFDTGGQFASAFVFGGVSADGVTVPNAPSLNFGAGADFSIDAWILPSVTGSSGVRAIFDKRDAPDGNTAVGYALFLFNGRLGFQLADAPLAAGAHSNFVSSGPDLRDGAFHHVAVTVVRNSSTGGTLYVDGCVVLTFDPTLEPGDLSNNKPLLIGKHPTVGFSGAYRGRIDEVEIFDRALLASEIHDIFLPIDGKCKDSDKDGVLDDVDCQPNSDLSATVVIDGCDSLVPNVLFGNGCTILDLISFCADAANTHGEFTSCVNQLTNDLMMQGIISGMDLGLIQSCAAQANIP